MLSFESALLYGIPFFTALMALEFVYGHLRGRNTWENQADAISSLSSGLTFVISNLVGFGLLVISYQAVHGAVAVAELPADSPWVWLLAFVALDFASYWVHRWAHENNFLWTMHVIHHSSEEFNLPVALRQNAFKWFAYRGLLLTPIAIAGVPVEVFAVIAPIHYFMQYWYHTQHIGKLGWLEYVIVTPSQHRVHHAINDQYIDKNYGNIFCTWDRLFGTFQEELEDVPCIYGTRTPVRSYNPIAIELKYFGRLLVDAWATRGWRNRLRVFASRTGWRPADAAQRFPRTPGPRPEAQVKYRPELPGWLIAWGWAETGLITLAAMSVFAGVEHFSSALLWAFVLFALAGICGTATLLEARNGLPWYLLRGGIAVGVMLAIGEFPAADRMHDSAGLILAGWLGMSLLVGWIRWRQAAEASPVENSAQLVTY